MYLHFYTTFDRVKDIQNGGEVLVWTKENKRPYDVHVSFDVDKYDFEKYSYGSDNGEYWVKLKSNRKESF